jgi:hypothetical protein
MLVTNLYKSPEGIEAYKRINYPYPFWAFDQAYENFMRVTRESPEELNQRHIYRMVRVQSSFINEDQNGDFHDEDEAAATEGEDKLREYIVYDMIERRLDSINNELSFYRSNLGLYYIPVPQWNVRRDAEGFAHKFISGIANKNIGFSIPFTKKNVERLRKEGCLISEDPGLIAKENMKRQQAADKIGAAIVLRSNNNSNEVTRYYVQRENDTRVILVNSFKDWLEGSFEDLYSFSRAHVSKEQKERRKAAEEVAAAQRMYASGLLSDSEIQRKVEEAENRNKVASERLYK